MKRILSMVMLLVLCMGMLSSCSVNEKGDLTLLNGKKIIFVGNSFTYFGKTVLEKKQTVMTQAKRSEDHGYFYELCHQNGVEVEVTNWTFGGHTLEHTFGGNCAADRGCDGVDHALYLTDRYFDYVVIQEGSGAPDSLAWVDRVMEFFKEANPQVKFVFLEHSNAHFKEFPRLTYLKELEKKGLTVVDWGALVADVANGVTTVPGGTKEYNKNSFIISKSKSDGYHPNMLAGYITTLMTYCAITGARAEGQPYEFCTDGELRKSYDPETFTEKYYTYSPSNFMEIFNSESDMRGLQKLVDRYLDEKGYLSY